MATVRTREGYQMIGGSLLPISEDEQRKQALQRAALAQQQQPTQLQQQQQIQPPQQTPQSQQAPQSYQTPKQTSYDLMRQRVQADESRDSERRAEAMQRQLAGQGLTKGSGLGEKIQRHQELEDRLAYQRQIGNIDVEEARAKEASGETEKQRQFITGERLGTQDYTSKEAALSRALEKEKFYGGLGLEQQKIANQASQFNTEQEFKNYALKAGLSEEQAKRAWQSQESSKQIASTEKLAFANLSSKEKELAQAASQFSDEMAFKGYALERGLNEEEAKRVWEAQESSKKILSEQKIAFANLSLKEKELAEQSSQFDDEQSFKYYALESGASESEADRAWKAAQAQQERESTEKIAFANLSLEEQKLSEQARQFDNESSFKQWAKEQDIGEVQAERAWQANKLTKELKQEKELTLKDLSLKEQELAEKGREFDNEQSFKYYALESGASEAEAERAWKSIESDKQIESIEAQHYHQLKQQEVFKKLDIAEAAKNRTFQESMTRLQTQLEQGTIRLEDILTQNKELRLAEVSQYNKMGMSGQELSADDLRDLQINNQLAYNAYMDGKNGKAIENNQLDYESRIDQRNALISGIDPKAAGANFDDMIQRLFTAVESGDFSKVDITGSATGAAGDLSENISPQKRVRDRGVIPS